MKIIVVDDEKLVLSTLQKRIKEVSPESEVVAFDLSQDALEYAQANDVDIAFLDISMPVINGITLAKSLKKIHPQINVIFCTAHTDFMQDAIELHASGYLLKPATRESINKALGNLLYPAAVRLPEVFVRTFGEFDIFIDGKAVTFNRQKAKEMLAYLVDMRCGVVSKKDLAAVLFGDEYSAKTQDYLKKIYKDLVETLRRYGVEKMLVRGYNQYALDATCFSCDLYDYEKGLPYAINAYKGEYMLQYDWAEM